MLSRATRLAEEYDRRIRRVDIAIAPAVESLEHVIGFSELRALDLLCKGALIRALPDHPELAAEWHVFDSVGHESPQHVIASLSSKKTALVHGLALLGIEARTSMYVSSERLRQLRECSGTKFDLTKLVALCEELNVAHHSGLLLACSMLTRAILDHVPPIFGASSFREVANNYQGGRSFRDAMQFLEQSSRKVADSVLHTQVRDREGLPTAPQVDFRAGIDMLLQEVTRTLKAHP
jgi:hypothetical protein